MRGAISPAARSGGAVRRCSSDPSRWLLWFVCVSAMGDGKGVARVAAGCELTILMPCLNEAETLARCIEKARGYLARSGIAGEIIIADNGSTDGSQMIAKTHGASVVDVPSRGYG